MQEKLIKALSKYGNIELVSVQSVLTILITGSGLTLAKNFIGIQTAISAIADDKYPEIVALKNEDNYFLIVLKPTTP